MSHLYTPWKRHKNIGPEDIEMWHWTKIGLKIILKIFGKNGKTVLYLPLVQLGTRDTTRSSRWQMFIKIGVLEYFANFTGKHLCCSLFLIKLLVSGLQLYQK